MRFGFMLLAASVAAGTLWACKKSGDDASARMAAFKDKMCACKDRACIDQVTGEMAKWSADHRGEATEKASEADQKKMAGISEAITKCMTQVARDAAAASATGPGAAGSAADGSGSAGGDGAAAGGTDGAGAAGGAAAGSAAGAPAETMAHRAGNCPSTVLGATTKVAVKGKAVVVTIESSDKDAVAAIRKRADELLAEKQDRPTGVGHDMKGTHGGSKGLCPVYVPDGAKAKAQRHPKGVSVAITTDKPDELAKEIDGRIARAVEWVKANVKPGDKGNQGGVGGGKGEDGSNHSGKGDGKGHERKKDGDGGGKGTGGGGGAGTGGGARAGKEGKGGGSGAGSSGW
jgi:hypothetical protein